jgi:ABC-type antimicrobial peptide transport system permease subunit
MHHIPSVHAPFPAWAAVLGVLAAVILAGFAGRLVRRHLARLAACLVIGAAAAFGVTAWADGQRHAALAAAGHAARGHAVSVAGQLVPAFILITVVVAAVAFAVSALVARRRASRSYSAHYDGQYAPSRRGW